ncbi:zinc finger and SCAN domain-containing protein 10-like isoform X2 [Thrips palmi]|uniref:Zinc finger and SCAN domain-containing protein 10-like isoform X2 n=1 Tax=Thrips palmi TaxID=161013 RepID=A0A6P8YPL9_THRPL|nr:zinc finger and SCAN domain-containing protein 10-like isoform X2 [Thrips palmi]
MANYSPQHRNESPGGPGHWQQSVNHLQPAEGPIHNSNGASNGTSFQRQEQPGRMAPYGGTPWTYNAEHIRIPAAPEPVSYSTQTGYPTDEQGQRLAQPRIWNVVKDEPEDLTGRHRESKTLQDTLQRSSDAQTTTGESDSESDSDLCIDEQTRAAAGGPRKRKNVVPANVLHDVTPAELQKRPGLIPLTSNLAGPVQVMTAKDGAKLYSCPECNLFYADHLAFEIHLQAHGVSLGKRHICKECGTSFRRREHLDAHMTAHSQDRPFSCETCGRAFKRNEHLTRHRVLHSGDKQHVCSDCGKSFFRKDHLMKHSQTHIMRKLTSGEG